MAIKAKNGGAFPNYEKRAAYTAPVVKHLKFDPADDIKKLLTSGLLLVTGPFKINGVRVLLTRVNQSYVIATSTKVDISGVDAAKFDDKYFGKKVEVKNRKGERKFYEAGKKEKNTLPHDKKDDQKSIGAALKACICIDAVPDLKSYLGARLSHKAGMKSHELVF